MMKKVYKGMEDREEGREMRNLEKEGDKRSNSEKE